MLIEGRRETKWFCNESVLTSVDVQKTLLDEDNVQRIVKDEGSFIDDLSFCWRRSQSFSFHSRGLLRIFVFSKLDSLRQKCPSCDDAYSLDTEASVLLLPSDPGFSVPVSSPMTFSWLQ
jgi:hypothetical protein